MMERILLMCLLLGWPAVVAAQDCFRDQIGLDPVLPTLTAAQWNAGLNAAAQIVPRLGNGTASTSGKVYVLAIGYSNTSRVFQGFMTAAQQSGVLRSNVKLLNGAISGKAAPEWANPNDSAWTRLIDTKLANQGLTPAAIGAMFVMMTNGFSGLSPAENTELYKSRMRQIRANLTAKGFTNRKIDYIASNYYGGYDVGQDKVPGAPHVLRRTGVAADPG